MTLLRLTFRSPVTKVAGAILLVVAFVAAFGNFILPTSAYTQDITHLLAPPSLHHLLGTDYLGRDNLARIMLGTRASILGALEAVGIGCIVGVVPGLFSVFLRKWSNFVVMRFVDTFMTLPAVVFTIGVVAVLGDTQQVAMAAIGLLFAPHFFRITRAATLGFATAQYVQAAELLGMSRWKIIRTHVWKKVFPTVAVTIASTMAGGILIVSSLSFLGVGAQPPMPTWGGMLSLDMNYLSLAGYQPIFPGIAIVLTVGALGIVADGIRDAFGVAPNVDIDFGSVGLPEESGEIEVVAA